MQQPKVLEFYTAEASATALKLNILGNDLTLSDGHTLVQQAKDQIPSGLAEAKESLLILGDAIKATVKGKSGSDDKSVAECSLGALEAIPLITSVADASCPRASVNIANANPVAQTLGTQFKLNIDLGNLLESIGLKDPVAGDEDSGLDDTVIDSVTGLVSQLTGQLPEEVKAIADDTTATLDTLVEDVLNLKPLARISLAPALAESVVTDDTITAHAKAQALRIELLPLREEGDFDGILEDLELDEPLLTIIISEAEGSQVYHRSSGVLDPAVADSSLVKIKIGPGLPLLDNTILPLLDSLGLGDILAQVTGAVQSIPGLEKADISLTNGSRELTIKGPGTFTLLEGTPLETTIVLSDAAAGPAGFAASGLKLHALKGINSGIEAALSDITGGNGADLQEQVLPKVVETPRVLASTGGPLLPIAGMAALALALAGRRAVRRREA